MVKKSSIFFTRDTCSQIFTEYVEAYIKTILSDSYSNQTIMFVMQERGVKKASPSVVPHDVSSFSAESLEKAVLHAASNNNKYELDLILYSAFENGYKDKDVFTATFACRDGKGNTVHQMYKFDRKKKAVTPHPIIPYHNKWVPPIGKLDKFRDPVLPKIAADYAMVLAQQEAFSTRK